MRRKCIYVWCFQRADSEMIISKHYARHRSANLEEKREMMKKANKCLSKPTEETHWGVARDIVKWILSTNKTWESIEKKVIWFSSGEEITRPLVYRSVIQIKCTLWYVAWAELMWHVHHRVVKSAELVVPEVKPPIHFPFRVSPFQDN